RIQPQTASSRIDPPRASEAPRAPPAHSTRRRAIRGKCPPLGATRVRSQRRQHGATALAESDAYGPVTLTPAAHRDLVSILEESADLTGGKRHGLVPAPRELEKTSALISAGPRNGTA